MKCVKIYTLKFHEQNNEVLIDMNSYMRTIAYNEFINFYKILMFCKEMYIGRLHLAIVHLNRTLTSSHNTSKKTSIYKNPSLVHISLKSAKCVREGFSILSIIIEFLQRLHSDRKV